MPKHEDSLHLQLFVNYQKYENLEVLFPNPCPDWIKLTGNKSLKAKLAVPPTPHLLAS